MNGREIKLKAGSCDWTSCESKSLSRERAFCGNASRGDLEPEQGLVFHRMEER